MDRQERLSENELITALRTARRQLFDLRTAEQRFGSDSLKTRRIFTPETFDIEATNVQFNNTVVEVTFTPDNVEDGLGGVLDFDYTLDYEPSGFVDSYIEPLLPSDGVTKWRIYLNGSDFFPTSWARLKFYVFANGSGTISAALV